MSSSSSDEKMSRIAIVNGDKVLVFLLMLLVVTPQAVLVRHCWRLSRIAGLGPMAAFVHKHERTSSALVFRYLFGQPLHVKMPTCGGSPHLLSVPR